MRLFYLSLFLLFSTKILSQDYYFGLFANSYLATSNLGSTNLKRVNIPISIIYSHDYCSFYLDGKIKNFFKIRGYTTGTQGEYLHTSFVSEETDVTPDGYYGIMIDEGKTETIFQVSLPTGFTYVVNKAKKYGELGKVDNNVHILSQKKEFESDKDLYLERKTYWDTVTNVNFISNPNFKKKHLICKENINEVISEKFNFHTSKPQKVPFLAVYLNFNLDTTGKFVFVGNTMTGRYPDTTIVEPIKDAEIFGDVAKLFEKLPWEKEKSVNGKLIYRRVHNCEVEITLFAYPLQKNKE